MTSTTMRGRALLAALLLLFAAPLPQAAAQDDAYTATVTVDATSDSVAKARDIARIDGARRALNTIVEKLAGGAGKGKPLKLSDNQVTDLVASFEVANEKMSAVRYTADYTYHFKPNEVARAMQSAGIAVADTSGAGANQNQGQNQNQNQSTAPPAAAKLAVVLPIYQSGDSALLWDDPNPWREAWSHRPAGSGGTLTVPLGDVSDLAAIDADKARSGDSAALTAIAQKEGADDVLVMIAAPRTGDKPGLDVTVRRYRAGQFVDAHVDSIDAKANEADIDLCRRAADVIAADLDNGWKNAKGGAGDQQGSVTVVAAITGLDDWIKLRDRLATIPSVRKIDVKALSRQEATIEIQYIGGLDQLKANLGAAKLDLQGGDPIWRLAHGGDKP
ncbi:MAG TPA: DUF2066 domain-containing protein [Stellaceae bacterium]|nr:DUF2066 domain-containing protein [Stellaceae bacterium]